MTAFIFGTVGSPASTPAKPGGSIGTIQYLSSIGLFAFEIGWVRSVRVSENTCREIKAAALENKVGLSVHAPYYINLNADNNEWAKSRKRLMDAAYYGNLAGATDIIFHPGSTFGDRENALKTAIPRLEGCLDELHIAENPVRLRPETMGKSGQLGSFEDILTINTMLPEIEPCFDFAHLHARAGDGSCNTYDEWSRILEQLANNARPGALQRLHCHLSGIAYTAKGEKHHLMLRDSDFDLLALLKALAALNCGGRIVNESPGDMDRDALYIKETWEEISG
ncbi:MAG: TIM barrel protein [Anaerolineales bacterium]|nr:TIM barrel protein [Anaerolineales bacterium]